jgi:hypothetical protein
MGNKKKNKIGFKTDNSKSWAATTKKTAPKDTTANDKLAIVFFDQVVLNGMKDKCIDAAKESEWQIHHLDLRVEMERNGITVSLFFPMAFYNFDQEVGPSSVDWETADADKEAESVKEVAMENLKHMIKEMPIFSILGDTGMNIKFDFGDFGSIHRHPGRFGFSSIDTRKDPDNPGVIYRRHEAENLWQVDSVMYMAGKESDVEIYTTECRILNIKEAADGGVDGTYCKIPTLTFIRDQSKSIQDRVADGLTHVFGSVDYDIFDEYTIIGGIKKYPLLKTVLEMFKVADYKCDTSNVLAERITQKVYGYTGRHVGNQYRGSLWGDDEDYYYDYGYGYDYGYNGYSRYSGYHNAGVKYRPKGLNRFDVEKELMDLCPFPLNDTETDFIKDVLDNVSYIELRELFHVASEMREAEIDAEYELFDEVVTP